MLSTLIGNGPWGCVFLASDQKIQTNAAVKIFLDAELSEENLFQHVQICAQSAARLNHPGIVSVYDWGTDTAFFVVSEVCRGASLEQMLTGGARLSLAQAKDLGIQAASALAYAHGQLQVHGNIKPANILFNLAGALKLSDFGLDSALNSRRASNAERNPYSAPELKETGAQAELSSDIYSLALVLGEAVIGPPPSTESEYSSYLEAIRGSREMDSLGPALAKALHPVPTERISASGLAQELAAIKDLPSPRPLPLNEIQDLGFGDLSEHSATGLTSFFSRERLLSSILMLLVTSAIIALTASAILFRALDQSDPQIPPLAGLNISEAEIEAQDWAIKYFELRDPIVPAGEIITTQPEAGARLKKGDELTLTVSLGEPYVTIPESIIGISLQEASLRLVGAGLEVGEVVRTGSNPPDPAREIVLAVLAPISEVPYGTQISLRVGLQG